MINSDVIIAPIVTEKALIAQASNCYSFWVNLRANKNQIRRAIFELFGVKPINVRTMTVASKSKMLRKQNRTVKTSVKKKALIQLKEGDKIKLAILKK